jgi:hypothetical protein
MAISRKYETKYGDVIIRATISDIGIVHYSGVLVRDGQKIELTRCELKSAFRTEDEERSKRHLMLECIVERFEKSKLISPEEVAVGVIGIVSRRLREHVARG